MVISNVMQPFHTVYVGLHDFRKLLSEAMMVKWRTALLCESNECRVAIEQCKQDLVLIQQVSVCRMLCYMQTT